MNNDTDIINARAFLYDLLSVGFAYPAEELFQSIRNGQFASEARERITLLPEAAEFKTIMENLGSCNIKLTTKNFVDFESEYIALFEHNQDPKPLHLNAHLYGDDKSQPIKLYRRLQELYRSFNIELKPDQVTEQPDHLSIQLEFLAYLHHLLVLALEGHAEPPLEKITRGISLFCQELNWTQRFKTKLLNQSDHPFYVPLTQLMTTMLSNGCAETATDTVSA